jgi:hypothetical protein
MGQQVNVNPNTLMYSNRQLFMNRIRAIVLMLCAIGIVGCATAPASGDVPEPEPVSSGPEEASWLSSAVAAVTRAGIRAESLLNKVFDRKVHSASLGEASECSGASGATSLVIESGDNEPSSSSPGGVFRNTVIVHLCIPPGENRQVVHAPNIIFKGKVVYRGKPYTNKNMTRSRQALYSVMDVAKKAAPGEYELETVVTVSGKTYTHRSPFTVIGNE